MKFRNISSLIFILMYLASFLYQDLSYGLPIGFGYNQGDREFIEMKSDNFIVYQDKKAIQDAKLALQSLEAAKSHVERWFKIKRSSPLIVNMSAISDNPSFANFITDSIELQTLGHGGRDLAWHEYTHAMMYQHLENLFGSAGAILHLPWMDAWFIEGLAETLSVSVGSDEQAGIEKFQALTGKWPSWDRLHSLYTAGPFNFRGYATSGAFVSWILRKYGAEKLPTFLEKFRRYTMPWYWPWSLTPLNGFWPMDTALQETFGKPGKTLYEEYKTDATKFWSSLPHKKNLAAANPKNLTALNPWQWKMIDGQLTPTPQPDEADSYQWEEGIFGKVWTTTYAPKANRRGVQIHFKDRSGTTKTLARANAQWVNGPWVDRTNLFWLESSIGAAQLCIVPLESLRTKSVRCSLKTIMPQHLTFLGVSNYPAEDHGRKIILSRHTEKVTSDQFEILELDTENQKISVIKPSIGGKPVSAAYSSDDQLWVLIADHSNRHMVRLKSTGECLGMVTPSDFTVRLVNTGEDRPATVYYAENGYGAKITKSEELAEEECRALSSPTSPLKMAVRSKTELTLSQALEQSSIWSTNEELENANDKNINEPELSKDITAKPAKWRGRPLFVFPWIGAEDALGPQLGIVSVPLMDHMQNETVRITMLYGLYSRFPYQEANLTSTRFTPTLSLSAFRAQVYNGRYIDPETNLLASKYMEEGGVYGDGSLDLSWRYVFASLKLGLKSSKLKSYIGPSLREGMLSEPYGSIVLSSQTRNQLYTSLSLRTRVAPSALNKTFEYDVVGASWTGGTQIKKGKLELGLDGNRTRGPKRRDLQEMYQPLKTLIPGSGGGLNQTSYGVTSDYGLFTPRFGENQARARAMVTHPVIQEIDKFLGLVYLKHLDFSGFFNYGSAWSNSKTPPKDRLIAAHGYNLDLFMDNKGVNFNLGLGVGQVVGNPWQGYWSFGMDAIF